MFNSSPETFSDNNHCKKRDQTATNVGQTKQDLKRNKRNALDIKPKLRQVLPSMDPTFCRTILSTEFLQVLAFICTIPTSHVGKVSLQYWKRYKRDFCSEVIYFVNVRCCTYQAFGTSFGGCLYLAIVN